MGCLLPLWSYRGMFSSCASVLTMVAPMRSPVKEPGPDMKVILVISCQVLLFSCNLSRMNFSSFSAKSFAKVYLYSLSSNRRIVSGVDVSK